MSSPIRSYASVVKTPERILQTERDSTKVKSYAEAAGAGGAFAKAPTEVVRKRVFSVPRKSKIRRDDLTHVMENHRLSTSHLSKSRFGSDKESEIRLIIRASIEMEALCTISGRPNETKLVDKGEITYIKEPTFTKIVRFRKMIGFIGRGKSLRQTNILKVVRVNSSSGRLVTAFPV